MLPAICLKVDTDDTHEDQKELSDETDFSDNHPSHPDCDKTNKNLLGTFEDKLNGKNHYKSQRPKAKVILL